MSVLVPTDEQQAVLDESGNVVVQALPGSGKTFTMATKIRTVLDTSLAYQGVIAISFTNKSSEELQERSLAGGLDGKCSFFGTIDSFIATNIIPFLRHFLKFSGAKLQIVKRSELAAMDQSFIDKWMLDNANRPFVHMDLEQIGQLCVRGILVLEAIGLLALGILYNSQACRRFIRARYRAIFVDEYQDCSSYQDSLFRYVVDLGVTGFAVGDPNQSIYAFRGCSPRYFISLLSNPSFKPFSLTENRRCHVSIARYAAALLTSSGDPVAEKRVALKTVRGSELDTGSWIDAVIPKLRSKFAESQITIALLARKVRTLELTASGLQVPHVFYLSTPLDAELSAWSAFFSDSLACIMDPRMPVNYLFDRHLAGLREGTKRKSTVARLTEGIESIRKDTGSDLTAKSLGELARLAYPGEENSRAVNALEKVLAKKEFLQSYSPLDPTSVGLMTIHKAKGLEFDVVMHLDLHEFILPAYKATPEEVVNDLNLHYVAVTRARKVCYLCYCTEREKSDGGRGAANPSSFLSRPLLKAMRLEIPP